jgi:hypothetical protein
MNCACRWGNTDRAGADWLSAAKIRTLEQWASGAAEEPQPIALLFWGAYRQHVQEFNHQVTELAVATGIVHVQCSEMGCLPSEC